MIEQRFYIRIVKEDGSLQSSVLVRSQQRIRALKVVIAKDLKVDMWLGDNRLELWGPRDRRFHSGL